MDDDMGDDMGDDLADELGAPRFFRRRRRRRLARRASAPAPRYRGRGELRGEQLLPFPGGMFTAAVNALVLIARPQRDISCQRLNVSLGRNGVSAAGRLVTVTAVTVAAEPQFVATGAFPADMFAFNATGGRLRGTKAEKGTDVTVALGIDAGLAGADTVTVSVGVIGPAAF